MPATYLFRDNSTATTIAIATAAAAGGIAAANSGYGGGGYYSGGYGVAWDQFYNQNYQLIWRCRDKAGAVRQRLPMRRRGYGRYDLAGMDVYSKPSGAAGLLPGAVERQIAQRRAVAIWGAGPGDEHVTSCILMCFRLLAS